MKKIKLNNTDILSVLGQSNIEAIQATKTRTLKSQIEQYVLLTVDNMSSTALHNGIISFGKVGYDLSFVSFFSIAKTSSGLDVKSFGDKLYFFRITWDGVSYLAIKKPSIYLGEKVKLISMNQGPTALFEVVDEILLSDISTL